MDKKKIWVGPHALSTPFDPDNEPDCDLISETTQEAIEELCLNTSLSASPGFAWGRRGTNANKQWLRNYDVQSNLVGIPFSLSNGELTNLWVGNRLPRTFDITLYHHTGGGGSLTALVTVSVVASRTQAFDSTDFGIIAIPQGVQLAVRITDVTGSDPKETAVFAIVKGAIL